MKLKVFFVFLFLLFNFGHIFSNDNIYDPELEGMSATAQKIIDAMKEGKFGDVLLYCTPDSKIYKETKEQITEERAKRISELIKDSNFFMIKKSITMNNRKGIIIIEVKKNISMNTVFWIFKKIDDKYYIDEFESLDNRDM